MIKYIKGSLFSHSLIDPQRITILAHACNCRGSWGAGVARQFKSEYPIAFKNYNNHCTEFADNPSKLLGTTYLAPTTTSGLDKVYVACLFTSDLTGRKKLPPQEIVKYTESAMLDLFKQLKALERNEDKHFEISQEGKYVVNMPKINAGLFAVPWEDTSEILDRTDFDINVYVI